LTDSDPFGASGKIQGHAVAQHGRGERLHVFDGGRVASVNERAGAHGEHQGLAGPRARTPGDMAFDLGGSAFLGPRRAHQFKNGSDDLFTHRHPAHKALGGEQVFRRHGGTHGHVMAAGGGEQHAAFRLEVWIVHIDLGEKTIELGFRQRIGAFLFERVLRRKHMERGGQFVAHAGYRHLLFLHRLQQGRLGAR
jgi:hypothetical protein